MKKLKGFTLIELMVAMGLLSAVMLLGGFLYSSFIKYHNTYEQSVEKTYEGALIQHQLTKDFQQADSWEFDPDSTLCLRQNQELLFCYTLTDTSLIRMSLTQNDQLIFQGKWLPHPTAVQLLDTRLGLRYSFYLPKHTRYERN